MNQQQQQSTVAEPSLEIVVVSFERVRQLMCLLWSLECQTYENFKIRVIHDGANLETREAVVAFAANSRIKIDYSETPRRLNDFGHSLRQWGLQETKSQYVLITNDDNYYTPNFLQEMMCKLTEDEADIVYCDMVHSHVMFDLANPIGYQTLLTEEKFSRIDIGCFIFNALIGKRAGFRTRGFNADWDFFSDMLQLNPKVTKLSKVLFVHN
jgi:glycosyltransferase involved in cell wall biosynthesis